MRRCQLNLCPCRTVLEALCKYILSRKCRAVDIRPTVALVAEAIPTLVNGQALGIHRPSMRLIYGRKSGGTLLHWDPAMDRRRSCHNEPAPARLSWATQLPTSRAGCS